MTRNGVKKMYEGWVTVINSPSYAAFFDKRNDSKLMASAIKQLPQSTAVQGKF
jgi:hypothetical protein